MDRNVAEFASSVLQSWGFRTRLGETVGSRFHNFSAPDSLRYEELQGMLDDGEVQAILFGRGGYGILRILDQLDFTRFRIQPKWLCGYSDVTALHVHVNRCFDIATLHSVMCSGITEDTFQDIYVRSLRDAWCGKRIDYSFQGHGMNRNGVCEGMLCGGNLSLLANLSGTISQPDMRGKILFVEDVGEYRYSIDRMMINLKRAGWLEGLGGLVAGSFTGSRETDEAFGQNEREIIWDKVKEYDFPVAFDFPVGHQKENYALKLGVPYRLEVAARCFLKEL